MKKFEFQMMRDTTDLVVLKNDIVKARYKLSITTQKLMLFLISHITYEERKEGKFLNELNFQLSEILEFFGRVGLEKSKDLRDRLKDCIKEIQENAIAISKIGRNGKEEYQNYPWYSGMKFNENTNEFIFKFNQEISSLLLDLNGYFKSNFKEYLHLKSSYAIDLYILFRANEFQKKHQRHSLEELKKYLQVDENKAYERWDLFKMRVFDPAIEQLSQNTHHIFTYELERVGRNIGFITIRTFNKEKPEELKEYILDKVEKHLEPLKLTEYMKSFRKMDFHYDPHKDQLKMEITIKKHDNFNSNKLDEFIAETELDKKVFFKIFRKKTGYTYITKREE